MDYVKHFSTQGGFVSTRMKGEGRPEFNQGKITLNRYTEPIKRSGDEGTKINRVDCAEPSSKGERNGSQRSQVDSSESWDWDWDWQQHINAHLFFFSEISISHECL